MGDYGNNELETYVICPDDPTSDCVLFDLGGYDLLENDTLFVYEGEGTTGPLLASFSGQGVDQEIISQGDCITVQFVTDESGTSLGYEATWNCNPENCPTSVESPNELGFGILVFPNPFINTIQIQPLNDVLIHDVRLYSYSGKNVIDFSLEGLNKLEFDTSHLPKGIYFIAIESSEGKFVEKVIKN